MYESKKENALKTLDKKQSKVEEINKVLYTHVLLLIQHVDDPHVSAAGRRHTARAGKAAQGTGRIHALGVCQRQARTASPLLCRLRVCACHGCQRQLRRGQR